MSVITPPPHPGSFVKENVLPKGVSVKKSAEMMGVGRPALSNFLNGNSNLSQNMASRLEKAFGADKDKLLNLQREYDLYMHRDSEKRIAVKSYTISFLKITATQIDAWADRIDAQSLLPALLRRLVNTTGGEIVSSDFPAYDHSQKHGWDGTVESNNATPWIPSGVSKWEFGCGKTPKTKANGDYTTRTKAITKSERENTTFVFVTPRNWPKKDEWIQMKKAEKKWKDVRVFDANDIEQWLEHSVPGQVWLAEQLGLQTNDCQSLNNYWLSWSQTANPAISPRIFDSAIVDHSKKIKDWNQSQTARPFVITAASKEEAMAFLCCIADQVEELHPLKEQAIFVSSADTVKRLAKVSTDFIPIAYTDESQNGLVNSFKNRPSIIIPERNIKGIKPDICLDLPNFESFREALKEMGFDDAQIDIRANQSGKSPTILRRQSAEIPAFRKPAWATSPKRIRSMIPLVLAGAWKSNQDADQDILQILAKSDYSEIEKTIAELASLDDSPLWCEGKYRGVVSELDCIYAISDYLTEDDIENFLFVAQYVLSEDDPALDLEKENRWAANIYNKVRDHSSAIRKSLCQNLIILAVHGNGLFGQRLGINIQDKISYRIHTFLKDQNSRVWQAQMDDLPRYAEAAPDIFLSIVEEELKKEIPAFKPLFELVDSGIFSRCERTGILWALELLAWNPLYLPRVIKILGKLSTYELNDNWANKPINSLKDILLIWRPHTAAAVEQRCEVLDLLCQEYPEIGWEICIQPLKRESSFTSGTHRPSWRSDASGAGNTITRGEAKQYALKCIDLVLSWPTHTKETLKDLVSCLPGMDDNQREKVTSEIKKWFKSSPSDEDVINLREHIRTRTMTSRAQKRNKNKENSYANGKELYDLLESKDPLIKHQWLFAKTWTEYTPEELEEEDFDHEAREEKLAKQRLDALKEILETYGTDGLLKLITQSGATAQIGEHIYKDLFEKKDIPEFILKCLSQYPQSNYEFDGCISGIIFQMGDDEREKLIQNLVAKLKTSDDNIEKIYRLFINSPFDRLTWNLLGLQSDEVQKKYWLSIYPGWNKLTADDINFAIECLLEIDRPRAAFNLAHFKAKLVESKYLIRLLNEIATNTTETDGRYKPAQYEIEEALKVLNDRDDFDRMELVKLEFFYVQILYSHSQYGLPNLSKEVSESPLFFMQLVAYCFKRDDDGQDPEDWQIPQEKAFRENLATNAHYVLEHVNIIPGTQKNGAVDVENLREWILQVRKLGKEHGRAEIADQQIGKILSTSQVDESDGVWPKKEIRDIFEEIGSTEISTGMEIGLYNSGGAEFREVNSSRERSRAQKY